MSRGCAFFELCSLSCLFRRVRENPARITRQEPRTPTHIKHATRYACSPWRRCKCVSRGNEFEPLRRGDGLVAPSAMKIALEPRIKSATFFLSLSFSFDPSSILPPVRNNCSCEFISNARFGPFSITLQSRIIISITSFNYNYYSVTGH